MPIPRESMHHSWAQGVVPEDTQRSNRHDAVVQICVQHFADKLAACISAGMDATACLQELQLQFEVLDTLKSNRETIGLYHKVYTAVQEMAVGLVMLGSSARTVFDTVGPVLIAVQRRVQSAQAVLPLADLESTFKALRGADGKPLYTPEAIHRTT